MATMLATRILESAQALPEGGILSPKEFLHWGQRASVDQTFTRLVKEGQLLRAGRGLYTLPREGRFGIRPPAPEKLLVALAQKTGEQIVSHGAAAANRLGLTTQVPLREIFLTSGRSRTLRFGARILELRHAPSWQLYFGEEPEGALIRALYCLGAERTEELLPSLRELLVDKGIRWERLAQVRLMLPDWLSKTVSRLSDL